MIEERVECDLQETTKSEGKSIGPHAGRQVIWGFIFNPRPMRVASITPKEVA